MNEEVYRLQGELEDRHWWFRARREIVVDLGALLLPESGTIVDVGCGTGGNLSAFPDSHARVGVDPSSLAITIARRKCPGVRFVCGLPPEAVGPELERADLVLLTDVLEHVEDDRGLLRGLVARMKVGAGLLLTVPAHPDLWSSHDVVHQHHRRYTEQSLSGLWVDLRVRVRLLAWFNRRLYPVARSVRTLRRRFGSGDDADPTDLYLPPRPVNWVLYRILRGEGTALKRALARGEDRPGGPAGLSLVAILETAA